MLMMSNRILCEADYFDENGNVVPAKLEFKDVGGYVVCSEEKGEFSFSLELAHLADSVKVLMPIESLRESGGARLRSVTLLPGIAGGVEGDGGALVLPLDSGRLCHTKGKSPAECWFPNFRAPEKWQVYWSNMALVGQYANDKACAIIMEEGKFDAQLRVRTNWGKTHDYTIDPVFFIRDFADEALPAEGSSIIFAQMSGDYRSIAKFYREYNLNARNLPPLKEKAKNNPDLDYSARAITVRCRMGVKPLPCTILEQTPDNEPPVNVMMTFADIRTIADEFAKQGVGDAEFCLVGWGHGGHDGAFPKLFPVEEAFGGEKELRKTIEHVQKCGYHISLHDNYYDGYTLAENFDLNDTCLAHDGSKVINNCGVLAGGVPYRICAKPAEEKYAADNLPRCARLGINGAYFVDVISIIGLETCYSSSHPLSRRGNAEHYKNILKLQQKYFNVSMSEGARDWALPEIDRTYMVLNCMEVPLDCVDEVIPLYQMVYHGIIIYNNFREGVNAFAGERLYLLNLAWGGLPMAYFHHLFHPEWGAKEGWTNDLTLKSPEKLSSDTVKIKKATDDVQKLSHLRFEYMTDFRWYGEEVSETLFSNGQRLFVNYTEKELSVAGAVIPSQDFILA